MSDRTLVPRANYIIAVQSSGMQVDPLLGFLVTHTGHFSSGGSVECCALALEFPIRGLVGQECEHRSLRTQARVWLQGEDKVRPFIRS